MKQSIFLLWIMLLGFAWSQSSLFPEEMAGKALYEDPSIESVKDGITGMEDLDFHQGQTSVGVATEFHVTSTNKFINLPVRFKIPSLAQFTFKAYIPLILQRKYEYFNAEAKASGIGDLTIGGDYWLNDILVENLKVGLQVTLPTGNENKTDNNFPVPLGNGVYAFNVSVQGYQSIGNGNLFVNMGYRTNTYQKENTFQSGSTITSTKLKPGNILSFAANFRMPWKKYLLTGSFQFLHSGESQLKQKVTDTNVNTTTETAFKNGDSMTFMDLKFMGKYLFEKLFIQSVYVKFSIPVYTSTKNSFYNTNRSINVVIGITKGL